MKSRQPYSAFPFVMFILGAGVAMIGSYLGILTLGTRSEMLSPSASDDGVAWQTVTIGGIVTFEVPKDCVLDPGAGTAYLVCPTEENDQPLPEMAFSSDGVTVNVRRYENLESPYWEHIVASMSVVQPMDHDITINIQE
jgi:hypothetical protein